MPVYALTAGLTQKSMRIIIKQALDSFGHAVSDVFPDGFRTACDLTDISFAIKNIHFPQNEQALEIAKRRLVFEELLLFCVALSKREKESMQNAVPLLADNAAAQRFLERLGFSPTSAQIRVMHEIAKDLKQTKPMNRLLQGDVGSGKTMPAFYAMHLCVQSGFQCAMMVPTEVLAIQHFAAASRIFCDFGINLELITGSMPAAHRQTVLQNTASGQTDIVIGTHAVLYDRVQFAKLGLIITDEQHRFGVGQRALLESKTRAPHILTMSATPIPRSLALILYGETNLSVLDEMPPGRLPVKTYRIPEAKDRTCMVFLKKK